MHLNIRQTLVLGIGIILLLFVISGVFSSYQTGIVVEEVKSITDVSLARNTAAFEMEINVAEIGLAVKGYLHTPNLELLDRMANDTQDFQRALKNFQLASRAKNDDAQVARIRQTFTLYQQSAAELIRLHDQQAQKIRAYRDSKQALDHNLHVIYDTDVTSNDSKGLDRRWLATRMSNNLHAMGEMLANFLLSSGAQFETEIANYREDFLRISDALVKVAAPGKSLQAARERHQAAIDVANQVGPIVALSKQIDAGFKNFLAIRSHFDDLLDNNVQPATLQQLNTASATAIGAAKDADVALRVMLSLGLAVGLLVGIATARVVIRHIRELTLGVQAVEKGDLSSRVIVRPRHEFATLCESFNSMVAARAQAEASLLESQSELQAKVETRTVDLHRANRLLQQELDIRRVTEKSLDLSAAVFNSASDAIVITDDASMIVMANKAFERITGYDPGEAIGKNLRMLSDKGPEDMSTTMTFTLRETGHWQGQRQLRKKDGDLFPAWESISLLFAPSGQIENQIWVFSDITPLKRSEEQLRHLAHHDSLTGCPIVCYSLKCCKMPSPALHDEKSYLACFSWTSIDSKSSTIRSDTAPAMHYCGPSPTDCAGACATPILSRAWAATSLR